MHLILLLFNLVLFLGSVVQIPHTDPAHSEPVGGHAEHRFLAGDRWVRHQPGYGQDTGSQARLRRGSKPGRRTVCVLLLLYFIRLY